MCFNRALSMMLLTLALDAILVSVRPVNLGTSSLCDQSKYMMRQYIVSDTQAHHFH